MRWEPPRCYRIGMVAAESGNVHHERHVHAQCFRWYTWRYRPLRRRALVQTMRHIPHGGWRRQSLHIEHMFVLRVHRWFTRQVVAYMGRRSAVVPNGAPAKPNHMWCPTRSWGPSPVTWHAGAHPSARDTEHTPPMRPTCQPRLQSALNIARATPDTRRNV